MSPPIIAIMKTACDESGLCSVGVEAYVQHKINSLFWTILGSRNKCCRYHLDLGLQYIAGSVVSQYTGIYILFNTNKVGLGATFGFM